MREALEYLRQRESEGYLSYCGFGHVYSSMIDKAIATDAGKEFVRKEQG